MDRRNKMMPIRTDIRPNPPLHADGARLGETTLVSTLGARRLVAGAVGERQDVRRAGGALWRKQRGISAGIGALPSANRRRQSSSARGADRSRRRGARVNAQLAFSLDL